MPDDRRRHPRKRVDLEGECRLADGKRLAVRVSDMSLGGAYLDVEATLHVGTKVRVVVDLADEAEQLDLEAVVRWSRPDGIGVQFGLLGARDTYLITEFLARRTLLPDVR